MKKCSFPRTDPIYDSNKGFLGYKAWWSSSYIRAHSIKGEILTGLQESLGPLAPNALGKTLRYDGGSGSSIDKHGMYQFLP